MCNSCRVGLPTKKAQPSVVLSRKNSVGKPTLQQYDIRDYDTPFGEGVWQSLKTSTTLSLLVSIFISLLNDKTYYLDTLAYFIGVFIIMAMFSGIITLIFIFSIAYPMTFILRYLNLLNDMNMALVGGFFTFSTIIFVSRGGFFPFHYLVVFWGLACGYAFSYAYNKK